MNDTIVTVVGNVVDAPRRNNTQNGAVTNFRLASTARRFASSTERFVDSGTFWVDVECWNGLSSNVSASISKGDPVIVHGALTTHSWESDAGPRSKPRIKAFAVGPNLQKGRSLFTRDKSARSGEEGEPVPPVQEGADGDEVSASIEELRRGRDYVDTGEALNPANTDDLTREPVHV